MEALHFLASHYTETHEILEESNYYEWLIFLSHHFWEHFFHGFFFILLYYEEGEYLTIQIIIFMVFWSNYSYPSASILSFVTSSFEIIKSFIVSFFQFIWSSAFLAPRNQKDSLICPFWFKMQYF